MNLRRNQLPLVLAITLVFCLAAVYMIARTDHAISTTVAAAGKTAQSDARLAGSYRFARGAWTYVHLAGSPSQIGYQHGYLLAPEISDALAAVKLQDTHDAKRDWDFFRKTARESLWPHIDAEYQQEMNGIVAGVQARGVKIDIDDVVAMNAFMELPGYYVPWLNAKEKRANPTTAQAPGNCTAFVATGSWTKDHQIVIAHNNWTSYLQGERWRIIFDITPQNGYRMVMDGFPGVIVSDDDFGVNSDGLMVTETTISQLPRLGSRTASPNSFARAKRCNTPAQSTITSRSCSTATTAATPTIGCSAIARRAKSRNSNSACRPIACGDRKTDTSSARISSATRKFKRKTRPGTQRSRRFTKCAPRPPGRTHGEVKGQD